MRSLQYEGRQSATPSGFDRHAATFVLSTIACPDSLRVGALRKTSSAEVRAAVCPKEFYVERISYIRELSRT